MTTQGLKISSCKLTRGDGDVHAELYRKLVNDGIEVKAKTRLGNLRCDLAIVKDGYVKCAIEVLPERYEGRVNTNTRKFNKYKELSVPTVYCVGEKNINDTISFIKENMLQDEVPVGVFVMNDN